MRSRSLTLAWTLAAALTALGAAWAQPGTAERVYASDLALCNSGQLSAPAREACVREAGRRRDAARGGPPPDILQTTPDGRATVLTPEGAAPPPTASEPLPTRDGRATVVPAP